MAVKVSGGSKGALEWDVILDMTSAKKQAKELAKLFADIKLIDQSKVKKESGAITEIQNEQVAQVKKTQDKITISPQPKSATTKEDLRDDNQLIIELTGSSGQFVICC